MLERNESTGLLDSLARLASSLAAIVHTRLDLLSLDLEEDRQHWLTLLALSLASVFFLGIGVVLATLLLVVAFWESHRLFVLGGLAGGFLLAGLVAWECAKRKAKSKPKLFEASLAELRKDRQELTSHL